MTQQPDAGIVVQVKGWKEIPKSGIPVPREVWLDQGLAPRIKRPSAAAIAKVEEHQTCRGAPLGLSLQPHVPFRATLDRDGTGDALAGRPQKPQFAAKVGGEGGDFSTPRLRRLRLIEGGGFLFLNLSPGRMPQTAKDTARQHGGSDNLIERERRAHHGDCLPKPKTQPSHSMRETRSSSGSYVASASL